MYIELNVEHIDIKPRLFSEPFKLIGLKREKSSHDNFDRVSLSLWEWDMVNLNLGC